MMDLGSRESFNCTAASTMLAERTVRSTGTLNDIIESHTNSMVLWLHGFCDNLPFAEAQDIIQRLLIFRVSGIFLIIRNDFFYFLYVNLVMDLCIFIC